MTDLIGSVVSLTGYRDRDLLDTTVVSVLSDWLQPLALGLYRCVGEPAAPKLLLQASARRGEACLPGDPPWTPLHALPAVADNALYQRALAAGEPLLDAPAPGDAPASWRIHVFPVWVGQQRFGLLELLNDAPLAAEQQRLVAGVLKIYRNQLGLLDYSERDTLTGLLNRKTFDEQFHKCLGEDAAAAPAAAASHAPDGQWEARSAAPPLAMLHWLGVIDIDHFKRVNDNFGHLIGDEVLLLVARLLRAAFRHGDSLYRFGGEEFVVLLRAERREQALQVFERFRLQMQAFAFPQVGPVTASVGFTALRRLDTSSAAFERADRAVYHAKEQGRNQVRCHETLVEDGALSGEGKVGEIELF